MTDAERAIVERYVRARADELGLRDWCTIVEAEPPRSEDSNAEVTCIFGRKIARIRFAPNWRTEDPDEQRRNVVHELLHCHLDQTDTVITDDLRHCPSISQAEYDIIKAAHRRAVEFAVDGIASAIAERFPRIEWAPASEITVTWPAHSIP